jgi:hypothetical protein
MKSVEAMVTCQPSDVPRGSLTIKWRVPVWRLGPPEYSIGARAASATAAFNSPWGRIVKVTVLSALAGVARRQQATAVPIRERSRILVFRRLGIGEPFLFGMECRRSPRTFGIGNHL